MFILALILTLFSSHIPYEYISIFKFFLEQVEISLKSLAEEKF